MMIESMPSRWRRCESISPAGPAPTIPTCVRIVLLPSARPAIARHARLVAPVVVAELPFEVALLAAHDAEMKHQGGRYEQDRHPVGREPGCDPRQYEDGAHIHRIAKVGIDPASRERERRSPWLHLGAHPLECVLTHHHQRTSA